MHLMGLATEELKPTHTYVPWVVVNGSHTKVIQWRAEQDLLGLVCSLYQGQKPRNCSKSYKAGMESSVEGNHEHYYLYDKIIIDII